MVQTGRYLLGYETATDLGILRVGPGETLNTVNCNTADDTFVGGLRAKYPCVLF